MKKPILTRNERRQKENSLAIQPHCSTRAWRYKLMEAVQVSHGGDQRRSTFFFFFFLQKKKKERKKKLQQQQQQHSNAREEKDNSTLTPWLSNTSLTLIITVQGNSGLAVVCACTEAGRAVDGVFWSRQTTAPHICRHVSTSQQAIRVRAPRRQHESPYRWRGQGAQHTFRRNRVCWRKINGFGRGPVDAQSSIKYDGPVGVV